MTKLALLSVIALGGIALTSTASAADNPSIDVRGIALHATPQEAEEAVKTHLDNATFEESKGTYTLGIFTSPILIFGAKIVDNDNKYNFSTQLDYDLRSPQKVIVIARDQNFLKPGDMPRAADLLSSLTDKYGKPTALFNGNVDQVTRLDWISGASPAVLKDSECKHDIAVVSNSASTHNTNLDVSGGAKCGVWVMARFGLLRENPALVQWFHITVADFPSLTASNAYLTKMMNDGVAASQKNQSSQAAKPKL